MRTLICFLILFLGCRFESQFSYTTKKPEVVKEDKKYIVVSTFNELILETEDKSKAYETAHNLTLMGRVFSSKPCYFVLEKGVEK
jgi:hypothetical protein